MTDVQTTGYIVEIASDQPAPAFRIEETADSIRLELLEDVPGGVPVTRVTHESGDSVAFSPPLIIAARGDTITFRFGYA